MISRSACVCGNEEKWLSQLISGDCDWSTSCAHVQVYPSGSLGANDCQWMCSLPWGCTQHHKWLDGSQPLPTCAGSGGPFKGTTGLKCILDDVIRTAKPSEPGLDFALWSTAVIQCTSHMPLFAAAGNPKSKICNSRPRIYDFEIFL